MGEMITQRAVIEAIRDERRKWQELVDEVGQDRMDVPGAAGDWTFKDVAAHISFWNEELLNTLERTVDRSVEPYVRPWPEELFEPDGINEWAHQQSRDRSAEDVLSEADSVFVRLQSVAEQMPEETLNSVDMFDWQGGEPFAQWIVDRRLFNHYYIEHEEPIRQWLDGMQ